MTLFAGSDIASMAGQVLTLVGVLVSARWAFSAKKDSRATLTQVANDHDSNLRDDLTQVIDKLEVVDGRVLEVQETQTEHGTDIKLLKEGWQLNRDDIDEIMNTEQRKQLRDRLEWGQPESRREWRARHGY